MNLTKKNAVQLMDNLLLFSFGHAWQKSPVKSSVSSRSVLNAIIKHLSEWTVMVSKLGRCVGEVRNAQLLNIWLRKNILSQKVFCDDFARQARSKLVRHWFISALSGIVTKCINSKTSHEYEL